MNLPKITKRLVVSMILVAAVLVFLPQISLAHLNTWAPPFLKVNDKSPLPYTFQYPNNKFLDIPQSQLKSTFRTGQKIDFEIDFRFLPKEVNMNEVEFAFEMGDGAGHVGSRVFHTYKKPGSYIVKIKSSKPIVPADARGNIEAVLINVMPSKDYRLPEPRIAVGGKTIDKFRRDTPLVYEAGTTIRFDAGSSKAGSKKIVRYQWDFGDGNYSSGRSVEHTFSPRTEMSFVLLRATDEEGFFVDTYVVLKSGKPDEKSGAKFAPNDDPSVKSSGVKDGRGGSASSLDAAIKRFDSFYRSISDWMRQSLAKLVNDGELLSTKYLAAILVIAAFLGALHSLTPGHSKSIMTAVLISKQQSKARDVLLLASAITFMHTIVIYLLGFFMLVVDKTASLSKLMPYFQTANIALVILLGGWLVSRGIKAALHRRSHEHRSHDHGHSHDRPDGITSTWGMLLAGASGGIVPCIDLLSILILAASADMLILGLAIVFSFSLGLAASIVLLGMLVIRTKKLINLEERVGGKIAIYAPLITGSVVISLGIALFLNR